MKISTNSCCRLAAILTFFLLFANVKMTAQPISDANGLTATGGIVTTLTISNFAVPANDDRVLVVCTVNASNAAIPSLTFGGTAMNVATSRGNTNGLKTAMYYLVLGSGATSVTGNITATGTALLRMGASSYHNVSQSTAFDGATDQSVASGATSSTLPISSTVDGLPCDCIGYFAGSFTGFTAASGQTQIFQSPLTPTPAAGLAMSTRAGASPSVNMTWTLNGTTTGGGGVQLGINLKSASCPTAGTTLYVDAAAASGGTGATWACAFQNLQDAINAASSGNEIWVKSGTYLPTKEPDGTTDSPRDFTFYLKDGVAVYGGFDGAETMRSERDPAANTTILSGDIGTANVTTDDCYHVVLSVSDASTTVLDGFTVTKGNANVSGSIIVETKTIGRNDGGGMNNNSSSPTIANCVFSTNLATSGGGMSNTLSSPAVSNCTFSANSTTNIGGAMTNVGASTPTLTNCTFSGNSATNYGGAMENNTSDPIVTNCTFIGNSSTNGGAMDNYSGADVILINCIFSGNSASAVGGGMYNLSASPTLTNCTFSGNKATTSGGGMQNSTASPTLKNCIIWNNRAGSTTGSADASMTNSTATPAITYSLIQNWNPSGTGNLNGIPNAATSNYPNFVTPLDPATAPATGGDFHIQTCSPAVNKGTNTGAPTTDLFGNARPFGTTVDMGVHELQAAQPTPTITCPANQTATAPYNLADFTGLVSTGSGCGSISVIQSPASGTSLAVGNHTITMTATDANGTTATCTFSITVNSNCPATGTIWYVNPSAASGGNGASWACGFQNLQNAIDAASSGHEIWVKTATYKPTTVPTNCSNCGDRDKTFYLKSGVAVYGGFDGAETMRSERDPAANTTILSGDIGTSGNSSDNCHHVVLSISDVNTTVLDGFTVSGGNANGSGTMNNVGPTINRSEGGGMHNKNTSVVVENCIFSTNLAAAYGGGIYNSNSPITLTNSTISNNTASNLGGGVYNTTSAATITGCTISGNTGSNNGGGMSNDFCSPTITDCDFLNNTTPNAGGGLLNFSSSPIVTNCTFSGNSAGTSGGGGGVSNYNSSCSPTFDRCIFSGNTATSSAGMGFYQGIIKNCIFSGNSASDSHGALSVFGAATTITNCTFSGNSAVNSSGGITCGVTFGIPASVSLTNCLIWNNRLNGVTGSAAASMENNGSTINIDHSLIQNWNPSGTGNLDGIANAADSNFPNFVTPLDPATAPSTAGDFQIQTCSPVVNLGTNTGAPTNDLFGNTRPYNNGVADMGAHELQADQPTPSITCPGNQTATAPYTLADFTAVTTTSGGCGTISISQNPAIGTSLTAGNHTITMTATDAVGSTATCTFSINVQAGCTAPVLTCPATQTVSANSNCQSILADFTASATSSGGCGSLTFSQNPTIGTTLSLGNQIVTLTATDESSNTGTCNFTVSVVDNTAPSITCPAIQTVSASSNCTYSLANFTGNATATDNCGTPTKTQSPTVGTSLTVGNHTVTMTATDAASNSGTCNFSINVADNTNPAVSCPAIQTVAASSNCTYSLANFTGNATATDNCGTPTKTQSPTVGTSLTVGNHTVTITATDAASNFATCNFTVTVADQTAPSITCPANQNLNLNASCLATLPDYTSLASASDNCTANPSIVQSPTVGTSLTAGNQIVTLTATDAANNSATCNFTISVADQTAPSITCPANSTVAANASCVYILGNFTTSASANDNCGAPTKTQSPTVGTTLTTGNHTITITATDAASNSATCNFTLTVADQTAPSITCPATQTVSADNFGNYILANFSGNTTSSDNCGAPTETQSPTAGTTLTIGNHVITMTATDAASNSATCNFTVQVQAGCAAPILTCPATQTVSANSNCQSILGDFTASATASGGCGSLSFSQNPTVGTTLSLGNQTVTLTATDQSSNSGTCNFSVNVVDDTAPSIVCPTTQTVSADNFGNYILANFSGNTTSSDNCGSPTETQSPTAGTTLTIGNHVITMTATDGASNSATCNFTVQVQAGCAAPILTCPATQTVSANSNCQSILGDFTASATASGGCGSLTFSQNPSIGTTLSLGNQTVTLTATDQSSNTGTCNFTVSVVDDTAPSIVCPTTQTVSADNFGNYTLANFSGNTTSSDNCGSPTETQSPTAGTTLTIGNHVITMTATDGASNSATCNFTVQVQAGCAAPILTCPATQTVSANSNCQSILGDFTASATASGGCGSLTFSQNPTVGTTLNIGNQTVTLTATDQSNNSGTCNFTVSVVDDTAPSIVCPTTQTVSADNFGNYVLADFSGNTTSTDNCGAPTETQSPTAGTTLTIGNHVITMTATDGASNFESCDFSVNVELNCNATAEIDAPADFCPNPGATAMLTASGGGGYLWSTGSTDSEISVSPTATTTYLVTVTTAPGCTATASHTLIVKALPVVSVSAPSPVCVGTEVTLTASGGVSYEWNYQNLTDPSFTVTALSSYIYYVTVTGANGCTNLGGKNLIVKPLPVVSISGNTTLCEGQNTTLSAACSGCSYVWSTGATTSGITVTPTATTNYIVTVTKSNTCSDSGSKTVSLTGPCTCETNNLLENPGFESGTSKWTPVGLTVTQVSGEVHSGLKAIKMCAGAASGTEKKAALPTQTFNLKFWAKQDGGTAAKKVWLQFLSTSLAVLSETSATVTATSYTEHSLTATAPEATKWVKVKFEKTTGTGCFFVDDFCLLLTAPNGQKPAKHFPKFEFENPISGLSVFPNPTDNLLNFNSLDGKRLAGRVAVFNTFGQEIFGQKVEIEPGELGVLQVGHLPAGTYFLVLTSFETRENGLRSSERFVIFKN